MAASLPRPTVALVLAAMALAIMGFVLGSETGGGAGTATGRAAGSAGQTHAGNVLLAVPAGWRSAGAPTPLTGLSLEQQVAFVPAEAAGEGGMVAGLAPSSSAAPLPGVFVAGLPVPPTGEVVSLSETEAFRYTGVAPPGFAGRVTVYAVPTSGSGATVIACWARPTRPDLLRACESAVEALHPALGPSGSLEPSPTYARGVSAAVQQMNRDRAAARTAMGEGASYGRLSRGAEATAEALGRAAAAIGALEPPASAAQVQTEVLLRLQNARSAYLALAAAAATSRLARYETARVAVEESEGALDMSLAAYALIGYTRAA